MSIKSLVVPLAVLVCAACGCRDEARVDRDSTNAPAESEAEVEPGPPAEPRRREDHAVFRLGDNRLLAHVSVAGALHIAAGSAGFAKYVRFGMPSLRWKLSQTRDGVAVAVPDKLASIQVPLTAEQAAAFNGLILRLHAPVERRLGVKINGRKASPKSRVMLATGWQTVTVPIAEDRLVPGENFIAFEVSASEPPAIAWMRLASVEPDTAEPAQDHHDDALEVNPDERSYGFYGPAEYIDKKDVFVIPRDHVITYYVYVPESAHLVADVGGEPAGACTIQVRATADPASVAPVEGTLAGRDASVSLQALAGQVVRLDLEAAGCERVHLARARLTVAGPAARVYSDAPPPRYIVLWVMDTLRADRVRPFEAEARADVPNLERLAETGTVFRRYWVQGNESQTSHSSVWTSLYPVNHNVRTAGHGGTWKLKRRFARLPALLDDAGFFNIGVTANGYVTRHGGYGRNFDEWRNLMREGAAVNGNVPAARILDLGLEYMEKAYDEGPVFLFLGSIDTHKPWIGHEPWLSRYDPEPYHGVHERAAWPKNLGMTPGSMECVKVPEPRDLMRINAIYDSDVSYQDQQVGRLLEHLDDWGIANQTMVIVTADHGEELWEVGRCGHGASLRQTLVRVPLIIHYPPLFHGRVVDQGAEGVDILPTILDALDLPAVDALQGHSLIPMAQGARDGYPMPSYASQYEYAHAMRVANWKARVGRSGIPDLYDLASDPGELVNLVAERPVARRFMTDVMSVFLVYRDRWKKSSWGVASNMSAQAARELEGRAMSEQAGDEQASSEQASNEPSRGKQASNEHAPEL